MNTQYIKYTNTARGQVLNFVQELGPTPTEAPFVASIFKKKNLSMRDVKILLEYVARRAAESPLQAEQVKRLGQPTLPTESASERP